MQLYGWAGSALAAGLVLGLAASAQAADLGGNCCADLEERIAELEATTARKGNRKVSLTISGWVNEALFAWDDGTESNAYVGTNELEQSRFRVIGEAKIVDGWNAGYILELGTNGSGSKSFSQNTDDGNTGITIRKSAWFLKSKDLGKLTVGRYDPATYHLIDNVDTLLTRNVSDFEAAGVAIGAFQTRGVAGTPTWVNIMGGFNNATSGQIGLREGVRYDTPEFKGFSGAAHWGEDDEWDVSVKYKGELGDFALNAAIGYGESTDEVTNAGQCTTPGATGDCQWWGAGALVQHKPTGLFLYGGYGHNKIDLTVPGDDESETWYLQGGIEKKFFELGKTNIFAEYRKDDVGASRSGFDSSDLDLWAAGVAQNIENADMTLYALYRHYSGDVKEADVKTDLDDFDMIITGAKINF